MFEKNLVTKKQHFVIDKLTISWRSYIQSFSVFVIKGLKNAAGVYCCFRPDEAASIAGQMLGHKLITKQTGEAGRTCNIVMIVERLYARREFYFAIAMDRGFAVSPMTFMQRDMRYDNTC